MRRPPVEQGDGAPLRPGPVRPWGAPVLVGSAALVGTVLLRFRSPYVGGSYGICPSLALTGTYCAACGGLRAVHDLASGDLSAALGQNPLLVVLLPLAVVAVGWWLRRIARAEPLRPPSWTVPVTVVVLVTFTVARNVPALAGWLAPGGVVAPAFG